MMKKMDFLFVNYKKNKILHKYYSYITIRLKALTFYVKTVKLKGD